MGAWAQREAGASQRALRREALGSLDPAGATCEKPQTQRQPLPPTTALRKATSCWLWGRRGPAEAAALFVSVA